MSPDVTSSKRPPASPARRPEPASEDEWRTDEEEEEEPAPEDPPSEEEEVDDGRPALVAFRRDLADAKKSLEAAHRRSAGALDGYRDSLVDTANAMLRTAPTNAAKAELHGSLAAYIHGDAARKEILDASGIVDEGKIKDAVNLNNLDDWQIFHAQEIAG